MRGLAPSRGDFRAVRPLMALQQEPRALALESVASAFYAGEPDAADLETAVLRDLAWVVAFVDLLGEGAGHLRPARDALLSFLNGVAPGATGEWRKFDPWNQPLRHAYLVRTQDPRTRALVNLVAPQFQLGGVLFHPQDESQLRHRIAPQVFAEEIDWACVEIPDFEESLLPIRGLVMDALEAAGPEPEAEPFEESAGLRQTLLAYVPEEVGEALSVVTSYIYDQTMEEGDLPTGQAFGEGYVAREARALVADLRYIELRLEALVKVGVQTSLTADEVAILALVETALQHLRRAREEMAPEAVEAAQGATEQEEEGD